MYFKTLLLVIFIVNFTSCKVISQNNEKVIYESKNGSLIILDNNNYELTRRTGNESFSSFTGFSKGTYKRINNNLLLLNSNKKLQKNTRIPIFQPNIKVKYNEAIKDSLKIIFKNFKQFLVINNPNISIYISSIGGDSYNLIKLKLDEPNMIFVDKNSFFRSDFMIFINKDDFSQIPIGISSFLMFQYEHKENDLFYNDFEITFPDFSIEDFNYLYFIDEYFRIVGNKIFWNGIEFKKK